MLLQIFSLPNFKAHHKYKLSPRDHDAHFVAAEFATLVSKSGMFGEILLHFGTSCLSSTVKGHWSVIFVYDFTNILAYLIF